MKYIFLVSFEVALVRAPTKQTDEKEIFDLVSLRIPAACSCHRKYICASLLAITVGLNDPGKP